MSWVTEGEYTTITWPGDITETLPRDEAYLKLGMPPRIIQILNDERVR